MSFESPNRHEEPSEKLEAWKRIEHEVDSLQDRLGKEVDPTLKPLVVALRALRFGTTTSCEGHLDHGNPYPWVDVVSPLAERFLTDPHYVELKKKIRAMVKGGPVVPYSERHEHGELVAAQIAENEKTYRRLLELVEEFYRLTSNATRSPPRLTIRKRSWNQSRLLPSDAVPAEHVEIDTSTSWSHRPELQRLSRYQEEMRRFADFLRARYFESP